MVSPILYPEGVSDAAVEKALAAKKNISEHLNVHYALFGSQDQPNKLTNKTSKLTALDLMHYHVYGDYRLSMAPSATDFAPEFLKSRFDTTILRYKAITPTSFANPNVSGIPTLNYLREQIRSEVFDQQHGFLDDDGLRPESTEWFQRELAFGNSAMRFHLPSLGTLAVMNYTYKNINEVLSKALAESLEGMIDEVNYDRNQSSPNLPKILTGPFDAKSFYSITDEVDEDLSSNPLIKEVIDAIIDNQEYRELAARFSQVPDPTRLTNLAMRSYSKGNIELACEHFCKELLKLSNSKFGPGSPVAFKSTVRDTKIEGYANRFHPDVLDGILAPIDAVPFIKSTNLYVVDIRGKVYDIVTETESGESYQINGVPEAELEVSIGDLEDELLLEQARGKKGGSLTHPSLLVFQRIALDIFFSIEALLAVCLVPHQFFLVSPTVNARKKQDQTKVDYPYMENHITNASWTRFKTNFNNEPALLEFLSNIRLQHTIANIANSEKLILDSRTMEEFYRQDLRMAEVTWLAGALTDAGKVIFEKTTQPNLLAQMQYRSKGVDESVDLSQADIKPESVFYQIDSPILKDVIMKFDEIFINFTVMNAFAPTGKKKKKSGGGSGGSGGKKQKDKQDGAKEKIEALATAVWGSIERRSSEIVNREGIKPHILFDRLFNRLDSLSQRTVFIRDNYPPKWVGTNTITLLRSAPEVLGEKLDMRFYSDCMDEYMRHLKLVYKSRPEVAIAILSTITEVIVDAEIDVNTLRESFLARIKSQASKKFLKGTDIIFDPFRYVIAVMRTEIDIPLKFREEYVARKLDESQKQRIKEAFTSESDSIVLPKTHPEFKEREVESDEESELYGSENPFKMPLPAYYPKPGEILNTANPEVARAIRRIVGDPSNPAWPGSFHIALIGGSRMTATDSLNLKNKMLDPTAVFTVQPIQWIGSTQIWDGRENLGDKATPSTIAHFRRTLGVRFGVTSASRPLVTDIELVPNSDLSNYESILYTKYLQDKYDQASYVYIPAGGVFKNPSVLRSATQRVGTTDYDMVFEDVKGDAYDELDMAGTVVFKGDVDALKRSLETVAETELREELAETVGDLFRPPDIPLPEPEPESLAPDPPNPEDFVFREGTDEYEEEQRKKFPNLNDFYEGGDEESATPEKTFVSRSILHESMEGREQLPAVQRWQATEHLEKIAGTLKSGKKVVKKLSSSIDSAATKFESAATKFGDAADAFESASANFRRASDAYERSTQSILSLSTPVVDAIEELEDEIETPVTAEDIDDFSFEEIEEAEEELLEHTKTVDELSEGAIGGNFLLEEFDKLWTAGKYSMVLVRDLSECLSKDGLSLEEGLVATKETITKTKKQARMYWANTLRAANSSTISDSKTDITDLTGKARTDYLWRKYCRVIIAAGNEGQDVFDLMMIEASAD